MKHPVILFDGVCNLCNKTVQFIIQRDLDNIFLFASLQSDYAKNLLEKYPLPPKHGDSFVLFEEEKIYTKSTAALKVISRLYGWGWVKMFFIVPKFIRDGVYGIIARNRYRWFGKKDECMVPTPELKSKFIG